MPGPLLLLHVPFFSFKKTTSSVTFQTQATVTATATVTVTVTVFDAHVS
jgi:hypothetical protein